jgi:hypothetical protein
LDSTSLLRTADEALYAAKHQGRNRVLPAQKKYMCESQPVKAPAQAVTPAEPAGPPAFPTEGPTVSFDDMRYDQTVISERIYIPEEEP